MKILPKYPPSSVRPGSPIPSASGGTRSPEPRPYLIPIASARRAALVEKNSLPLFPHESEDARITGATRSLFRRLLALNLPVPTSESMTMRSISNSSKSTFIKTA